MGAPSLGDERAKWPPPLLTDSRVIHRWDEGKLVGHTNEIRAQLSPESSWKGDILWDAYLFYGADVKWDEAPTNLIHWGRTIVAGRENSATGFRAPVRLTTTLTAARRTYAPNVMGTRSYA